MKKNYNQIAFYSLIIVLTAQLNMDLFITGFRISVACICFPVLLFLVESFPTIPVTICSGIGVFLTRILFYWFQNDTFVQIAPVYLPELTFYLVYGALLYLYTKIFRKPTLDKNHLLFPLVFIDYAANLSELLLRIQLDAFSWKTQTSIFLIAVLRTLVVWCILTIFDRYRLLLLNKEHEERYKRLVFLISKLNGEIVWMQKNTALIENTMNTSYKLYEKLKAYPSQPELAKSALSVAKDIHEIKKEYLLIMRGISTTLDAEFRTEGMHLREMLDFLKDSACLFATELHKTLEMKIHCPFDVYTDKHYALLSIFRNLLLNAIEAATEDSIHILLTQRLLDDYYVFSITDDGPGICAEHHLEIFKTGFSTKINYDTGEVNRGLGLNLVQDLVENQLSGTLSLESVPGETTFTLYIPKEKIEVG